MPISVRAACFFAISCLPGSPCGVVPVRIRSFLEAIRWGRALVTELLKGWVGGLITWTLPHLEGYENLLDSTWSWMAGPNGLCFLQYEFSLQHQLCPPTAHLLCLCFFSLGITTGQAVFYTVYISKQDSLLTARMMNTCVLLWRLQPQVLHEN